MKSLRLITFITALLLIAAACRQASETHDLTRYVDPFIGTDAHGHTYPGAATPFGMVQLSPDTRIGGWDGVSGYHYSDSVIYGFSHTALSGTGVGDYGDILIMPVAGGPQLINSDYLSPFRKETESAEAGYYQVFLEKPAVKAEMTATTRVGYHRYTFTESGPVSFMIDLEHRDRVTDSWIEFVSDTEIRGMRRSSNWAKDMIWYFHMEFSKPFSSTGVASDNEPLEGEKSAHGTNIKGWAGFDVNEGEVIEVKVALSAVDEEGARLNLVTELPGWEFEEVRREAKEEWNEILNKIVVSGGTPQQKRVFYTAMYHAHLQPNTFIDVDNRYRGIDREIHTTEEFTNYTVFSLWDTYRTWHPLMTIIDQKRTNDYVRVMLDMYEKGGLLPIWELAANETYCMIGNHAISVIADAWMKDIRDYDSRLALEAMVHSATRDHYGLKAYREHGHIPGDKEHESISKTLEYAYNDWCIAMMAYDMGKYDIYNEYIHRAQFYRNIFDPSTGFMRPRLNGAWLTPFNPSTVDWHFTEANSWQYSFYVPHDITGLYNLHGGREQMADLLEELFATDDRIGGRDMKDITGLIGQYAHGNEPSHHAAYLFNYLDRPWRTQHYVRRIMDEHYSDMPDGLSGNEDCGQMSAWLIMSAMGIYPVAPGSPEYIIGTPWFEEMEVRLENGRKFRITAPEVSPERYYVASARLNGRRHDKAYISHHDIMRGGHLKFTMSDTPSEKWGVGERRRAVSAIEGEQLLPVPVIESPDGRRIRDSLQIAMSAPMPDAEIYYTLNGSKPDRNAIRYTGPVTITETTTVQAVAFDEELGYSFPVEASFVKINITRSVDLRSRYNRNYHAGGPEGLIDGIRGGQNWRLGGWQGYQNSDFEAVIDLGSREEISYLAAGFAQDIGSWIWMPRDVTFSVSDDGRNFRQVLSVRNSVPDHDYDMQMQDLGGRVSTSGRYVKVQATNYGRIPQWHLGAGGQAFIFIDEVIIE